LDLGGCSSNNVYTKMTQATGVTNGNPTKLTVVSSSTLSNNDAIWGATGAWAVGGPRGTGINGLYYLGYAHSAELTRGRREPPHLASFLGILASY
jgi:hypothetical protein